MAEYNKNIHQWISDNPFIIIMCSLFALLFVLVMLHQCNTITQYTPPTPYPLPPLFVRNEYTIKKKFFLFLKIKKIIKPSARPPGSTL